MPKDPNFIEAPDVEAANKVDLSKYRFVKYDERRGVYIFMIRMRRG